MNIKLLNKIRHEDMNLINCWIESTSPVCSIENMTKELFNRKKMLKEALKQPNWNSSGDSDVLERQIAMIEFAIEAKLEMQQQFKEFSRG